jgi:hypothetical protein
MIDYVAAEENGRPLVWAEIGVFEGEGSQYILEHLNIETLHLVDPYEYDDPTRPDLCIDNLKGAYDRAVKRLAPYKDKIKWWVMRSDDAFPLLPELHGVYLDGDHYLKPVRRDIRNAHRIVRPGGWVGGHDYTIGDVWVGNEVYMVGNEKVRIEVKPAVDRFVEKHGYYLFVAGDPYFPDWWVQKHG